MIASAEMKVNFANLLEMTGQSPFHPRQGEAERFRIA